MTVTYTPDVANANSFFFFWKALKIYRGSIYKIVWCELMFFVSIFLTIQLTTIYVLSESQQLFFKQMRDFFYSKRVYNPIQFILGFFVFLVVKRWRALHLSLPSADTFSLLVSSSISSNSERSGFMRRAVVRYAIVSFILSLRCISLKMNNKFPTLRSIVKLGILLRNEQEILEKIEERTFMTSHVIPLVWATNIIHRARKEGFINNDCIVQEILTELGKYNEKLCKLLTYDLVCIPLLYIQVVTLSIYYLFFTSVIGYQVCCDNGVSFMEIAVSLISASLELTFYVGWVKVSEVLINPFGEDDEDFGVDLMVDSNLKSAYMIVDYMRVKEPDYDFNVNPVSGNALYENISENYDTNNLYSSLEEQNVQTQTEDKDFQLYENVPVTYTPLHLLAPSQSSHVDYINIINEKTSTDDIIYSNLVTGVQEENNIYENIHKPSGAGKIETSSYSPLYVNYIKDRTHLNSEENIYENVFVASTPQQIQNPSESPMYVDRVNVIHKNPPADDSDSESDVGTPKETDVIGKNNISSDEIQILIPSQNARCDNKINVPNQSTFFDKTICKSDYKTFQETNSYKKRTHSKIKKFFSSTFSLFRKKKVQDTHNQCTLMEMATFNQHLRRNT